MCVPGSQPAPFPIHQNSAFACHAGLRQVLIASSRFSLRRAWADKAEFSIKPGQSRPNGSLKLLGACAIPGLPAVIHMGRSSQCEQYYVGAGFQPQRADCQNVQGRLDRNWDCQGGEIQ